MPYWTLSPIYFDPTGTLLSRRSIPSFSLHSRPQLKGSLREIMSYRRIQGISKDMGSQVLIVIQTVKES
jgi:hypothetical protein